jgi:hypothetical protein
MCSNNQYEKICKDEFGSIHVKLDKLDEAIRGNGKVGITTRLDRLEQDAAVRSKLLWLIAGSSITGALSLAFAVVLQFLKTKN